MRSLDYWNKRWAEGVPGTLPDSASSASQKNRASWPDDMARWLELRFIAKCLKKVLGGAPGTEKLSILEIGCGPFSLSEDTEIRTFLDACNYTGIDGSKAAIEQAQERSGHTFVCADLAGWASPLLPADCIISRRTLQNLTEDERGRLWPLILSYPHGIIVECGITGLENLNRVRAINSFPPLTEPDFNHYLEAREVYKLSEKATPVNFAGIYYLLTRGLYNLKDFNTQFHYRAASLSHDCPTPNNIAPLRGYYW